jgi:putative transposase
MDHSILKDVISKKAGLDLQDFAFKYSTYRFRKLFAYVRRLGNEWNHKNVYRVDKFVKLNRKRK